MKYCSLIFFLLCAHSCLGQEAFNLKTKEGQKVGKWVVYNENGSVSQVSYYEPYVLIRNLEDGVFDVSDFFSDTVSNADTVYRGEKLLWTEKYEYEAIGQLSRIIRYTGAEEPTFLYGPNKEIALKEYQLSLSERAHQVEDVDVRIQNESDKVIMLTPHFDASILSTYQEQVVLPPQTETSFTFQVKIESDENRYVIALRNDSISIAFHLNTFGFDLRSDDFLPENQVKVNTSFIYWRTGNEGLLRLYDKEKRNVLKTFSLAHEKTKCDLSGIEPGHYILCKQEFSTNQRTCCSLRIEK